MIWCGHGRSRFAQLRSRLGAMDGFAYELHELHELHEIQIHRVPYDSEESEEGTAPNPGKASNHRNALTWTRHWQRSHQSWKLWFGRFLMISLSVLLFLFFSPALLALIPLATLIYCRMAMLASKQRKHTLLSITWYFVAASAWPFCTVWWLGPEGPTHVAGGYFAFWLAVVLSLCVYAIANWEDLIEANRKMHLNEMLDLQSDWAWGWYVVGVVVDWYFFSVMALQNSLPKFLSSLQHEVPNEFWPLFSILATGKAITPGYGYTSILVFNIVLAMFPALSLADWLGFRWKSPGRFEDLVDGYRSIIIACFFTLLLCWDLRLIACREPEEDEWNEEDDQTSVFFDQKDPCWEGQHQFVALLSCFFITSFIPVVLPVTFRTDIMVDGDGRADDRLWYNPLFALIERPLKMVAVAVGILGKAADWESTRQLIVAIIPLLLAGMCHALWSSNHPGLNNLKKYLYFSAFVTAILHWAEHFLEDEDILKDAYPLMTVCPSADLGGSYETGFGWAVSRNFAIFRGWDGPMASVIVIIPKYHRQRSFGPHARLQLLLNSLR